MWHQHVLDYKLFLKFFLLWDFLFDLNGNLKTK